MGYEFLTHKKYNEAIQAFEKAINLYPKFYPSAKKNLVIANRELSKTITEAENLNTHSEYTGCRVSEIKGMHDHFLKKP